MTRKNEARSLFWMEIIFVAGNLYFATPINYVAAGICAVAGFYWWLVWQDSR